MVVCSVIKTCCTLLISLSFLSKYLESDCRVIAFVTKVDGKALDSNVIAEMGTKELIDFCGVQCFLNYDCVSYNFGPSDTEDRENICQLNNSTDHKRRLKPRAAYTYVETEVISRVRLIVQISVNFNLKFCNFSARFCVYIFVFQF